MQNFMKTILSAVQAWTKGKIKDSTANWNENDSNADSYVKNRTHWEEEIKQTILSEMTVAITDEEASYVELTLLNEQLVAGQTYYVTLNGVEYECIARNWEGEDAATLIGNGTIYGDGNSENNEPFSCDSYADGLTYLNANIGEHTISIATTKTIVHKLNQKYLDLPTNLATTDNVQKAIDEVADIANTAQVTADSKMDATNPVGTGSFSMNRQSGTTIGNYSHSEGNGNTASGIASHAEGSLAKATGDVSHAEGNFTTASGHYSHAEGHWTIASGTASHTEGYKTTASGYASHAEGNGTIASGTASHAEGDNTKATHKWQHVQGTCNVLDTSTNSADKMGTYVHIVGNGESDTKRSNAHTLDWSGNAWYSGDVYVGSTSGINKDAGSKKLVTEDCAMGIVEVDKMIVPISDRWRSIAYGDGKFLAVANNASIANGDSYCVYSYDGVTWIKGLLSKSQNWRSIAYGDGKFVAVGGDYSFGNNDFYLSSSNTSDCITIGDDKTLTYTKLSTNTFPLTIWRSIAYGNGKFVAVAYANNYSCNAAYSTDGLTWTIANIPETTKNHWISITYGNGKFVAITYNNNIAAYSEDGITWTETAMPKIANWFSVTYGNGKFVATIDNESAIAYSDDGIVWTEVSTPCNIKEVAYGDGKFVGLYAAELESGEIVTNAAYSYDGITWMETVIPVYNWRSVTYGDGKFVAISIDGVIAHSKDGTNWKTHYFAIEQDNKDRTDFVKDLLLDSYATEEYVNAPKSFFTLIDDVTSHEYIVRMKNGSLTSVCKASSLAVTTLPTKIEYTVGETFDSTGMIVTLTRQDGSTEEVTNYTYSEPDLSAAGTVTVTVNYIEVGETYSTEFTITVVESAA